MGTPSIKKRFAGRIQQIWAKGILWGFNIDIVYKGVFPERPFFMVCNHLSYLDIVVFLAKTPCVLLGKKDVEDWPFFGVCGRLCSHIFIDRNRKSDLKNANKAFAKAYNENQGIVVFPEGTSSDGSRILPFKSGILEWASSESIPVSVSRLSYETGPKDPCVTTSVCWWGDMTLVSHLLGLLTLSRVRGVLRVDKDAYVFDNRKHLSANIYKGMLRL